MHNFEDSLARAHERELDKAFEAMGWDVRPVSRELQKHGVDRWWIHLRSGREWFVEYKCDSIGHRTGNVFVETLSVDSAEKLGWAYTSKAQQLVYYMTGAGYAFVVPMNAVKTRLVHWNRVYPEKGPVMNKGRFGDNYNTYGLAVPHEEFREIASKIVHVELLEDAS